MLSSVLRARRRVHESPSKWITRTAGRLCLRHIWPNPFGAVAAHEGRAQLTKHVSPCPRQPIAVGRYESCYREGKIHPGNKTEKLRDGFALLGLKFPFYRRYSTAARNPRR